MIPVDLLSLDGSGALGVREENAQQGETYKEGCTG